MKFFSKTLLAMALFAAALAGAWAFLDAGQLAFQPSAVTAHACASGFQCSCNLPPTCKLWTDPTSRDSAGDVELYWDSTNSIGGSISPAVGSLQGAGGHVTVYIPSDTTFTGTFWNSLNQQFQCHTKVTVTPPQPSVSCTVSPASGGTTTTFTWTATASGGTPGYTYAWSGTNLSGKNGNPVTTTYSAAGTYAGSVTVTDSNGQTASANCTPSVTVTPPQNGCIIVHKEAYDTNGTPLTDVPQFSFTLDGGSTLSNNASGIVEFDNVTPGDHTVVESSASGWTSVTAASQPVHVNQGTPCAALYFKNEQVLTPPSTFTIKATKIVCNAESDLPNWSYSGNAITSTTATDYVASHPDCHLQPNWTFEWANGNQANPGDNTGVGGSGWTSFGPTNANGITTTTVPMSLLVNGEFWVREEWQSGYIPFTGIGGSDVSAEMYCNTDVKNYDNYDYVANPTAGNTYYCVAWNALPASPPNAPSCTLTANPNALSAPGTTTLTWTTTNATSASIDNGIYPIPSSQVSGGATSTPSISANTTFTMTVTGPGGTNTCHAPVTVTPPPGPSCHLSLTTAGGSPVSSINSGDSVVLSWTSSNVTSGSIDNNVGTASPVSSGSVTIYPPSSTTFNGTFTGPNGTATCSIPLTVNTGGGGGGGGGGGLNQPDVGLSEQPNPQPLAFVSLSQIPYTGFEAGPALTMIFWLAVAALSALIAYAIVGRGATRYALAYVLGTASGLPIQESDIGGDDTQGGYGRAYPSFDEGDAGITNAPSTAVSASVTTMAAPSVIMPFPVVPKIPATPPVRAPKAAVPEIIDIIESRAHAAGVLVSPEAAAQAAALSSDRSEALRRFGPILEEAVRTIPREDGWIMLTADKLHELSEKYPAMPPSALAPVDVQDAVVFAGAIASGDRESAFSIIRQLERDGLSGQGTKPTALMTATATAFDQMYRARHNSQPAPDLTLADKASRLSDVQLEHLVAVFTHALDHVYASPFTGVKLALAQAFEVVS
jgi:hypothetical protein